MAHLRLALVPAVLLLSGCPDPEVLGVQDNTRYFPLDGTERVWTYRSAEQLLDWTLVVEKAESSLSGDMELVTLEHSDADTDDLLWQVIFSEDSVQGVRVHGYTDVQADLDVLFDTPVMLVERGVQDEPSVTETSQGSFIAETSRAGCETYWVPDWGEESCLVVDLRDTDDDPTTHGIVTGQYRLVPSYGPAWLDLDAYDDTWWLSGFDWEE